LAAWFYDAGSAQKGRLIVYRIIAILAALTGALLLVITLGALWSHDQGWFFAPIEGLLKPKDRANLVAVRNQLDDFGWAFTLMVLIGAGLWLSLARSLWLGRIRSVAHQLVILSIVHGFVVCSVVMPVIAQAKSYREFMVRVNELVQPNDKLYLYGPFNSDSVMFYRGSVIEWLDQPVELVAQKDGSGDGYLIMPVQTFKQIQTAAGSLPPPLLESAGQGPEGDEPLVLMRAAVR
jgi:hypothetical protein